ncbi:uncharacterized protein LOC142576436 [Dermacentor variabilis]|uniref:uncharacterized protein LOC142576436 n=1 Tax=Dermacentor variabilis TaxID=34621 RepID=UPI003F5BA2CA
MMSLFLFFAGLIFCCAAESDLRDNYECSNSSLIDPWLLFNQSHRFDMLQRNYNYSYKANDSICVKIRRDTSKVEGQTVTKNVTYRNMSSTLPHRASALINFTFFATNESTPPGANESYNYANSTIISTADGFSLSPPSWNFLYVTEDCFVVSVLSSVPAAGGCEGPVEARSESGTLSTDSAKNSEKPLCELWVRRPYNDYDQKPRELKNPLCCEVFFNNTCNTSTVVQVFDASKCLHEEEDLEE